MEHGYTTICTLGAQKQWCRMQLDTVKLHESTRDAVELVSCYRKIPVDAKDIPRNTRRHQPPRKRTLPQYRANVFVRSDQYCA